MKRNLQERLLEWKDSAQRKPRVLNGARQVGKTWLLKEFATNEYEHMAYVSLDLLLQRAARLEISGIKTESATNTITARYEQKDSQTEQSDDTKLPAYISIVEFSTPKCLFNIRQS